jgi:hypothetical protein
LLVTFLLTDERKKNKLIGLSFLSAAMAAVYYFYLTNYREPPHAHVTLVEILLQPLDLVCYVLSLIGSPLIFWLPENVKFPWAIVVGCILVVLFLWFCYLNLRKGQRADAAPWIGLASFGLAFCMMNAYGRIGWGIQTGVLTSRYTTHALLFTIAVSVLSYLAFNGRVQSGSFTKSLGIKALLFTAGVCSLFGYFDGFRKAALKKNRNC